MKSLYIHQKILSFIFYYVSSQQQQFNVSETIGTDWSPEKGYQGDLNKDKDTVPVIPRPAVGMEIFY